MEAARIRPDSPSKTNIAKFMFVIIVLVMALCSGKSFSQYSHEVGLTENIAGAQQVNYTATPAEIRVYRNYPDPFSSSTTIRFENKEQSNVKIAIYDRSGNLVKAYLYDNIAPGSHEVNFDGSGLPAGEYTYRFTSGNYSQSYKMNIVK